MKSCCLTPTCCSQQRTNDDSADAKRMSENKSAAVPLATTVASSTDTQTPSTPLDKVSVQTPLCGCRWTVPSTPDSVHIPLCGCRWTVPRPNKSQDDDSDSSLDIDLDDPHLIQALEDCVQRGGGGGRGGKGRERQRGGAVRPGDCDFPQRDIDIAKIENVDAPISTTAERIENVDFISMFFKNNNPVPENLDCQTAVSTQRQNPCNSLGQAKLKNVSNEILIRGPQSAETTKTNAGIDELREMRGSVLSGISSSSPSCYQTGTDNIIPGVPANSPNDTSTSNSRRRLNVKHLQSFRRHTLELRRQRSAQSLRQKYVAKAIRHRLLPHPRTISKRSIGGDYCCRPRTVLGATGPAWLGIRPPCQGQEGSPVRCVVGVGKDLTPLARRRMCLGRDRTPRIPSRCCRTPPKGVTPVKRHFRMITERNKATAQANFLASTNAQSRCTGTLTISKYSDREDYYEPSTYESTQDETTESESNCSSRSSANPMSIHPLQPEMNGTTKVRTWLSHLDPEDTLIPPFTHNDDANLLPFLSTESAPFVHPVQPKPIVSCTINQFLYPQRRPRHVNLMKPTITSEARFPMSGCKRSVLETSHRCNRVKRLRHESSPSNSSYSDDNEDSQSAHGSRCGNQFGGYGERAVFEFPRIMEVRSIRVAGVSDTSSTKSSITEPEISEEDSRMTVPPPSESSQIVSNPRNNYSQNVLKRQNHNLQNVRLPSFEVLRQPISAMSAMTDRRQNCLLPEKPASLSYRAASSVFHSQQSGQMRRPSVNHQTLRSGALSTLQLYRQQLQVMQKAMTNTSASGLQRGGAPLGIHQISPHRSPPRPVYLADRRRLMVIRGLKEMSARLGGHNAENGNPLETLAIL